VGLHQRSRKLGKWPKNCVSGAVVFFN
jgi:hypothetical protein